MKTLRNIHPGAVLLEEFLVPLGISQNALARATGVPPRRINEIGETETEEVKYLPAGFTGASSARLAAS